MQKVDIGKWLFLIDLDGVILENSLQLATQFMFEFLSTKTEIAYLTIERFVKISNSFPPDQAFIFFLKSLGCEDYLTELKTEMYRFFELNEKQVRVDPHFESFISFLRENQLPFRIFSLAPSFRISCALPYIEAKDIYILNNASKADVRTFKEVLQSFKIEGNEVIYVDDDPFALRTAKNLQIRTILKQSDYFQTDDIQLYSSSIDLSINNFSELRMSLFPTVLKSS